MSKELRASNICVGFGGLLVIDDVSLSLRRGEILGLIGPNGAGKTTFVNVLTGFQKPLRGSVVIDGEDVTGWVPERRARARLSRTFQAVRLFPGMSVLENVSIPLLASGLSRRGARAAALEALDVLGLADHRHRAADALPYGLERRIGVARAIATDPDFILMDEPAAGLTEAEGEELLELVRGIRDDHGCGVLLIEHNMRIVFNLCERVHVLSSGVTLAEGTPEEVRADRGVREAYLGSDA